MRRAIVFLLAILCIGADALADGQDLPVIDAAKWQYNEVDGVYWQVGVSYCAAPADTAYETLGIFVPAAYMDAQDNGDGTYTCTVNATGSVAGYTSETAPIVIPVDTPGYSAMSAPAGYVSDASAYTAAGFVYVRAGCRGRDAGAPAGVTDLKAAVRYLRYSAQEIPGSVERIFTFGMSGGGAQSALVGAMGDSELYEPYLEAIGAVSGYSDAVVGSMCWCPITNLDMANEAYEWNMGLTRTNLEQQMQALSDGMSEAYTQYINALGLVDGQGNMLTLDGAAKGVEDTGSYMEELRSLIERSLNHFLEDTVFPYAPSSGKGGMGGRLDFAGGLPELGGEGPDRGRGFGAGAEGGMPEGRLGGRAERTEEDWLNGTVDDGIARIDSGSSQQEAVTYDSPEAYIAALNGDEPWIEYDGATNTATVLSVEGFVKACKPATKNVGAFDDLNGAQGENVLFGYGDGQGAHFDAIMAALLADSEYAAAYAQDLQRADAMGNTVDVRVNMYNPMYVLSPAYEGYGSANVAAFWRIRTGITQGDTALTTEMNLALALQAYGVDVDFETIWGQGHVQAERTGSASENFIQWVNDCLEL